MVPNVPIASAPGKESHSQILGTLEIHGGQVTREIILRIEKMTLTAKIHVTQ